MVQKNLKPVIVYIHVNYYVELLIKYVCVSGCNLLIVIV